MTTVTYSVPAIHCGHCTHTIEMEVGELKGVQSVKAEEDTKKVTITFDKPASEEKIKALLAPARGIIEFSSLRFLAGGTCIIHIHLAGVNLSSIQTESASLMYRQICETFCPITNLILQPYSTIGRL